jgi:hypothetical protein
MKRILLTIIFAVAVIFAYAEGHMTFKGIEIDGKLDSFVEKLQTQGFELTYINDYSAVMKGRFTAEDVTVFIFSTPISKLTHTVLVRYEPQNQWSTLENKYNNLVESLRKKYGEPSLEVWDVGHTGDPEHEIRMGRARIMTFFDTDNGRVTVSIADYKDQYGQHNLSVAIAYQDNANSALNESEAESDL